MPDKKYITLNPQRIGEQHITPHQTILFPLPKCVAIWTYQQHVFASHSVIVRGTYVDLCLLLLDVTLLGVTPPVFTMAQFLVFFKTVLYMLHTEI